MYKWISIKEEEPPVGIDLLTIDEQGWITIKFINYDRHWETQDGCEPGIDVTHWSYLLDRPLKKCPFCGGNPEFSKHDRGFKLTCNGCGIETAYHLKKNILIDSWNYRI